VSVSYLEIYNEALYDLLADTLGAGGGGELAIVDDAVAGGTSNVRAALAGLGSSRWCPNPAAMLPYAARSTRT
jgi:hypothetical protein